MKTIVPPSQQRILHCPDMDLLQLHARSTWEMVVYCMLLNRTSRKQVDKVREELMVRWPSAHTMALAEYVDLVKVLQPLGLAAIRATRLIRFSHQYFISKAVSGGYDTLLALYQMTGIGEYALDSYAIFQLGHINIRPADKELIRYVEWLGADVTEKKKIHYVLLADYVISQYDGDLHWVTARQLVRLYNLDPAECIQLESKPQWERWLRSNDHTKFTILAPLSNGTYQETHRELMKRRNLAVA